jgi:alkaline phosphatase
MTIKHFIFNAFLLFAVYVLTNSCTTQPEKPKYIFLFIGDGMGLTQVATAEAFQAYKNTGKIGSEPLTFTRFPVMGLQTTYSASNWITDSSASGTAMSSGKKTHNDYVCVAPDDSTFYEPFTYRLHKQGMKIGIMTSVSIDHATPACFYAHNGSRWDYYNVGSYLPKSGFEFFAGARFIWPKGKNKDMPSLYDECADSSYIVCNGLGEYTARKADARKLILVPNSDDTLDHCAYALGRKPGQLQLSEILQSAIEFLDNPKGFFIMCEGGMIDWAGHNDDAMGNIYETLDLSKTVQLAIDFYNKHPKETLIIVTADHETGGMALGCCDSYNLYFEKMSGQKGWIEDAPKSEQDSLRAHNKDAHIGWTSLGHTGTAVPVYAMGVGSEMFAGRHDNTDICKSICKLEGIPEE